MGRDDDRAHRRSPGTVAPTRSTTRSSITRSSLACSSSGSSPISSRNSVPPSASSIGPRRVRDAPVNAPRSWPNSSLSNTDGAIAAQSTCMNGCRARSTAWSARATTPLPVPLSPSTSTLASLLPTRSIVAASSRIGFESPISDPPRRLDARAQEPVLVLELVAQLADLDVLRLERLLLALERARHRRDAAIRARIRERHRELTRQRAEQIAILRRVQIAALARAEHEPGLRLGVTGRDRNRHATVGRARLGRRLPDRVLDRPRLARAAADRARRARLAPPRPRARPPRARAGPARAAAPGSRWPAAAPPHSAVGRGRTGDRSSR